MTRALARRGIAIDDLAVESHRGRVILRGGVATPDARDRAMDVAREVKGVQRVDNRLDVLPESPVAEPSGAADCEVSVYITRPGDTLPAVAERVLGNRSRWVELAERNRGAVGDPNLLAPGLRLTLPRD